MKTQSEMILEALQSGDTLTPIDALNRFGCFRLGARIWDLRHKGHDIVMTLCHKGRKKYAEYKMNMTK